MSQENVERFLGRLITDDGFCKRVKESLYRTCSEHGFFFTPQELEAIQKLEFDSLELVAARLDESIKRWSE